VDIAGGERLVEAMRIIERAQTLTGILDALVLGARAEVVHADVWLLAGRKPAPVGVWQVRRRSVTRSALLAGGESRGRRARRADRDRRQTVAVLRTELGTGTN